MPPSSTSESIIQSNEEETPKSDVPLQRVQRIQRLTVSALDTGKKILQKTNSTVIIFNITKWMLTGALFLTISIFAYASFYTAIMPREILEDDVNFGFIPCDDKPGPCSHPKANIKLNPQKHRLLFGQPYRLGIMMEVPDSYMNQELGMFMTCLTVLDRNKKEVAKKCKSSMLEFRSTLLRGMETVTFSPMLMSGATTERQWLTITFIDDFVDTPGFYADSVEIEILSKFVQIYSTKLQIHPQLFGLKSFIYHHQWLSATVGIFTTLLVNIFIVIFLRFNLGSKFIGTKSYGPVLASEKKEN